MSDGKLFDVVPGARPGHLDVEPNESWGKARARSSDPETSHAAAASVRDLTAKQQAVLDCLSCAAAPVTDQELALLYEALRHDEQWPEQSPSGLRTRRAELVDRGVVASVGRKRLDTGRLGRTWAAAGAIVPGGAA
jgi:hypothetical protein